MRQRRQKWLGMWRSLLLSTIVLVSAGSMASLGAGSQLSAVEDERIWSRKFLEARMRLRKLRGEHDRLSSKLRVLRSSSCGGGEDVGVYHNPYLLSKTEKQLERTRKELETAEQALAGLQESLRRSGKPVSWQDSSLAIEQPEQAASTSVPAVKDKDYWHKQLTIIGKRYGYLIEPLRVELFELVFPCSESWRGYYRAWIWHMLAPFLLKAPATNQRAPATASGGAGCIDGAGSV